jgi:hypothetical protein
VDLAQTITNAIVVAAVGTILGFIVHGLRAEMRAFRAEVRQDLGDLRAEARQDIGDLRREMGDLRSDLTQVALAVGARPRADRNR